ncbi:RNA polymerase sigma factor [Peterkaempfera sp. SMS 1(5)a]|uniref:RNA polymerase sigma factor n=1 Tax=Peterkaempfera podocarpi TaxID=3232308 RepID=UPI00366F04C9
MTTSADIQMPPAAGYASCGTERPEDACARQVDGLFTYCLSVLCDHDAALAAVRSVREMAVRHHDRLRDPVLLRAWLYSLARYACLLRLADGTADLPAPAAPGGRAGPPAPSAEQRRERHARLAVLAWPEAAGTTPQQREALELAVRHGLRPAEVAAVLGLRPEEAAALLTQAGCEVERTRTALRVLAAADCPELSRLGGGRPGPEGGGALLGPALRRELVQHVDDCPTCRGTAERAVADDPWPGTEALHCGGAAGQTLPLVAAPSAALAGAAGAAFLAGVSAGRRGRPGRPGRSGGRPGGAHGPAHGRAARPGEPGPRFDRQGFPRHRADSPTWPWCCATAR